MDFSELTGLGWTGIAIRIIWFITVVWKPHWHFNYEERLIQIKIVDYYVMGEVLEYIYMAARFILSTIILWVVTGWLI